MAKKIFDKDGYATCDIRDKATGKLIYTMAEYNGILDGEVFEVADRRCARFLTKSEALLGDQVARYMDLVLYKAGVGPRKAGGIDLKVVLAAAKKERVTTPLTPVRVLLKALAECPPLN